MTNNELPVFRRSIEQPPNCRKQYTDSIASPTRIRMRKPLVIGARILPAYRPNRHNRAHMLHEINYYKKELKKLIFLIAAVNSAENRKTSGIARMTISD